MNKKRFVLLVILMSLSLIGIISVQAYWIKQSVDDKEEQFSNAVEDVLEKVAKRVEDRERKDYMDRVVKASDSLGVPKSEKLRGILFVDRELNSDELRFLQHGILEEDYGTSSLFFDSPGGADTISLKNFTTKRSTTIFSETKDIDGIGYGLTPYQVFNKIGGLDNTDKLLLNEVIYEAARSVPIHDRLSNQEIQLSLIRELENRGINTDFEYGVYSSGFPTKIKSKKFKFNKTSVYNTPIFRDSEGNTNFSLSISFPKKKKFLIRSILTLAILSLVFVLVIIIAYSSAIYQLVQQKQISEIKSDFINNMTHEFKTPIATINLAVEAIKNPKSIGDKDKVLRYLGMIRDENKRMHAQVENVLRISKLEKNQLNISKDRVDAHDIITDAIAHIELIVEDRGGYVKSNLVAERSDVLANEMHFTNVIVNVLDNAVKYSPEAPKIDVSTEKAKNNIIIKIADQGSGMSKVVLKKVFEKFYREHTGNIHNVKGHGLGLAYVKKIIDDHQGEVYVESEKGKGSTFYIKLPLI